MYEIWHAAGDSLRYVGKTDRLDTMLYVKSELVQRGWEVSVFVSSEASTTYTSD